MSDGDYLYEMTNISKHIFTAVTHPRARRQVCFGITNFALKLVYGVRLF